MSRKIYHITLGDPFWDLPNVPKFDIAKGFIVVAKSPRAAKVFALRGGMSEKSYNFSKQQEEIGHNNGVWTMDRYVGIKEIGIAHPGTNSGILICQTIDG